MHPTTHLSLADLSARLLDRARVPISGAALQTLVAAVRGAPVPSQRLARIAGFERERYIRTARDRTPPRLCAALDEHGLELRPRVWARGDWRLARRILTPDVAPTWDAQLALLALELDKQQSGSTPELLELARVHATRALGSLTEVHPKELEPRLLATLPSLGSAAHTGQQAAAEKSLNEDASFSGFDSYFGRTRPRIATSDNGPKDLRSTTDAEGGIAFARLVADRVGSIDVAIEIMAYIQEWTHLRDELGRPPDSAQYAQRFGCSLSTAHARQRSFQLAFPGESDPSGIADFLRRRRPGALFARALSIPVIDLRNNENISGEVLVEVDADRRWAVRSELHSTYPTKADATAAARMLARLAGGGEVRIEDRSGRLIQRNVVSPEPAESEGSSQRPDLPIRDPSSNRTVLVECKSTNWDALSPDRVVDNARRHIRQIETLGKQQARTREIAALVLQYPKRPSTPGRAEEVESLLTRSGCEVVWGDAEASFGLGEDAKQEPL
jgi:hypothetical protein